MARASSCIAAEVDVREVHRPDATPPIVFHWDPIALEPLDHLVCAFA